MRATESRPQPGGQDVEVPAYDCSTCDRDTRSARRCPKPPLEWASYKARGGPHLSGSPLAVAKQIQGFLSSTPATMDMNLRLMCAELSEEWEQVMHRRHTEKSMGVRFGEDDPTGHWNPCAWYMVERDTPWIPLALMEARLDTNYRPILLKGDLGDHPAVMVDAFDVLRSTYAQIDREKIAEARAAREADYGR